MGPDDVDSTLRSLVDSGSGLLAVGDVGVAERTPLVVRRDDSGTWTSLDASDFGDEARTLFQAYNLDGVTIAIGNIELPDGAVINGIWLTEDAGDSWTAASFDDLGVPEEIFFTDAAALGDTFVLTGWYQVPGEVRTAALPWVSTDRGQTWVAVEDSAFDVGTESIQLNGVTTFDDRFVATGGVAVGQEFAPEVWTSADGATWTRASATFADDETRFDTQGLRAVGVRTNGTTLVAYSSSPWETNIWSSTCLLYTSPSPRDRTRSRMPSSA